MSCKYKIIKIPATLLLMSCTCMMLRSTVYMRCHLYSVSQFTLLMLTLKETPITYGYPSTVAAEVAASFTEWGLNMPVSMPAFFSMDFSHPATVEELKGLCGLPTTKNSLVLPPSSCDLKLSVFFS